MRATFAAVLLAAALLPGVLGWGYNPYYGRRHYPRCLVASAPPALARHA